jgi:methionyl-tRNA synthetase
MHKLCGGKVPKLHEDILDEKDKMLIEEIQNSKLKIEKNIEEFKFRDALFEVIDLSRKGNKYMQEKEPWIVAKKVLQNPSEAGALVASYTPLEGREAAQKSIDNCLHLCLQLTANLTILINPFLPNTAKKMLGMMKVTDKLLDWENAGRMKLLSVGYSLREPQLLFRKIEDQEITAQIEKLNAGSASSNPSEGGALKATEKMEATNKLNATKNPPLEDRKALKSEIVYDEFAKIDLKVGTILSAEKVEKADKLLKLQVDMGFEIRTIVSGIALHFDPVSIKGKQVVVVANLAPRKMRGIESNGMILMAEDKTGRLHFVSPDSMIDNGSGVT